MADFATSPLGRDFTATKPYEIDTTRTDASYQTTEKMKRETRERKTR
jgi:hypothetical protein